MLLYSAGILLLGLARTATAIWPKRGLGYNDDVDISQFGSDPKGNLSQVNWQYNWFSTTSQKQPWAEYVPMLWSDKDSLTSQWVANANYWLTQGGSGHLLGFNEPNLPSQANMTPDQAAEAYRKWITPFSGQAALGSPAPSSNGLWWLKQFLVECSDCGINFIAVHYYGGEIDKFKSFINEVCAIGSGLPLWLTEFSAWGYPEEQQAAFLQQAIPFLDNNDCVYRYAWFGTADNNKDLLANHQGPRLSALGQQYAYTPYGGWGMNQTRRIRTPLPPAPRLSEFGKLR